MRRERLGQGASPGPGERDEAVAVTDPQQRLSSGARQDCDRHTSYTLGLRGPSTVVDTGQSSSLVAVHLACENLLHGGSDPALAAGVSLNLAAETTRAVSANGTRRYPRLLATGRPAPGDHVMLHSAAPGWTASMAVPRILTLPSWLD